MASSKQLVCSLVILAVSLSGALASSAGSSAEPTPFTIRFDMARLASLKARLQATTLPDQLEDIAPSDYSYGLELSFAQSILNHWVDKYDPKRFEAELNSAGENFRVQAEGTDGLHVHFLMVPAKHRNVKLANSSTKTPQALLFIHGWPGSFWECHKIAPMIADPTSYGLPADVEMDVICPSLPGYGFSDAPRTKGFDLDRMADTMVQLMRQLNYHSYVVQGGDWGSMIALKVAEKDPGHCAALHVNFAAFTPGRSALTLLWEMTKLSIAPKWFFTETERAQLSRCVNYAVNGSAYFMMQATVPQTLGYALQDSPFGLATYILEKFHYWSDCNGNLSSIFSHDELLDNVMIYWATNSITSSMRLYYEFFKSTLKGEDIQKGYVSQPSGVSLFKDICGTPRSWVSKRINVQRWTEMEKGGHFAALEQPQLFAKELAAFVLQVFNAPKSHQDEL